MKGKIANLCIAGMNILFGIIIYIYTKYIPQDIAELTIQELSVTKIVIKVIYLLLIIIFGIDIFQYKTHRDNREVKTGYLIGIFSISFLFMKMPAISILPILSGLIVGFNCLRDNAITIDTTTEISVLLVICSVMIVTIGTTFFYKDIGQYIKNKEDEDSQKYTSDYFKYITELEISEPYINVKKDGKYGYITPSGKTVIDFKYDYASPFININVYNKDFQIALVTTEGMSYIIMKNERQVMSYKSETSDENYEAKMKELKDIYKNTLGLGGEIQFEIEEINNNYKKIHRYEEISTDYTYRYDYNNEYDILITKSDLGLGDKYELARKDNLNIKIQLDCENLDYDENYLYIYNNGLIPYYDIDNKEQGWFTSYGKKNTMTGKAQILDFIDDYILIRDYNHGTVYFIDQDHQQVSDNYLDIYCINDGYIVKNSNSKYMVIDKNFQKKFESEYDIIDTSLTNQGLLICANTSEAIDFNDYYFAKINWKIINFNGEKIIDNVEQVYCNSYKISNDKDIKYVNRYEEFLKNMENVVYYFVGDKFYSSYLK